MTSLDSIRKNQKQTRLAPTNILVSLDMEITKVVEKCIGYPQLTYQPTIPTTYL